jgi:RNA polymerase sigma-70 factor, ECF subfamily
LFSSSAARISVPNVSIEKINLLESPVPADYLECVGTEFILTGETSQDDLYQNSADQFGPALERLARAYEMDTEKRRDLIQEIHFQLWRSFRKFDARCSLRTWVYRVAHHVATSHVVRERRTFKNLVDLEELEKIPEKNPHDAHQRIDLERLSLLIQRLKPLDRQVIVSYLEDMDAASIGEITGLSPANVAVRIHRIKNILARRFHEGGGHAR